MSTPRTLLLLVRLQRLWLTANHLYKESKPQRPTALRLFPSPHFLYKNTPGESYFSIEFALDLW